MDNDIQRLIRWSMSLQPYQFNVKYRPGKELGNVDGLSRQDFLEVPQGEEGGDVRAAAPDKDTISLTTPIPDGDTY